MESISITSTRSSRAEVRVVHGRPGLFANDRPVPLHAYYMPHPVDEDIRGFAACGVHLFTWGFSDVIPHSMDMGWTGPDAFDGRRVDEEARIILEADPEALLLPRIAVSAPEWWLEAHPDDNIVYEGRSGRSGHTSLASAAWRRDAGEALRRLVAHIEASDYGHRVIGYQLTGGRNEWFYTFGPEFADFSPAATSAWRSWLRAAYGDDVQALRQAFGDPAVDFGTATVPTGAERLATPRGLLHDPAISRRVPDYWRFFAETTADALVHFCRVVKQTTQGLKLAGAFYGYTLNNVGSLALGRIPWNTGHLALGKVLRAPEIDFLAAPYQMTYRFEGGYDGDQTLPASIRLHGKLFFAEITRGPYPASKSRGESEPVEDGLAIVKRNFATRFVQQSGMWWMEWNGGDFRAAPVRDFLKRCAEAFERSTVQASAATTEIAVVVDEASHDWMRPGWELTYPFLFLQERAGLARIGAPFDVYLLDDLACPALPRHRLYLFLNCLRVTSAQRDAAHACLRRDQATALWYHASGLIDETSCQAANASRTVGMALAESTPADSPCGGPTHLYLCDHEHPVTLGLPPGTLFGTTAPLSPLVSCIDPEAAALGRMFGTHGVEPVGLAVKAQTGWTSVFCGVPNMPSAMLRNIARMAGCHLYSEEDDLVRANDRYLAVHVKRGGRKTFALPRAADVYDLFTGRLLARNTRSIVEDIPASATRVYELRPVS